MHDDDDDDAILAMQKKASAKREKMKSHMLRREIDERDEALAKQAADEAKPALENNTSPVTKGLILSAIVAFFAILYMALASTVAAP
jgi:hypothetical protein